MSVKKVGNGLPPYKIEDGVTQSMLSSFIDCRQRSKFSLEHWQRETGKDALLFGSMFHELIEKYYLGGTSELTDEMIRQWTQLMDNAGIERQRIEIMMSWAKSLLPEYCKKWKKDDDKKKWVELEGVFDVVHETGLMPFRLRGRCDGMYSIGKKNGKNWLFETKTAGRIDENTLNLKLAFDFQNLFYILAKSTELDVPIAGVLYNVIRKPQLKQKKNEELRDFILRVQADIAERPDFYFARFEISYPKKVQDRFRKELDAKLFEFNKWIENGMLTTYRNESACCKGWNCGFLDACASNSMAGYTQNCVHFQELLN